MRPGLLRTCVAMLFLAAVAPLARAQAGAAGVGARGSPPTERGRDPWVFRCIFEDRTRMVVMALGEGLWYAFNPGTGATHRVWRGEIDFRGKVWDFSQENSRAVGTTWAAAPSEILTLPDGDRAEGWTFDRVLWLEDGWAFDGTGATLTSPEVDLAGWQRVFVAFDERSRRGPIRVEISDDGGRRWKAQHFDSCLHVNSDEAWQWNFKEVVVRSPRARIRFVQPDGDFGKQVRAVRVFGDRPGWYFDAADGDPVPMPVEWRGYEVDGTDSATLRFDVRVPGSARRIRVTHVADRQALEGPAVVERIVVEGLEPGETVLHRVARAGAAGSTRSTSEVSPDGLPGAWVRFDGDGVERITHTALRDAPDDETEERP